MADPTPRDIVDRVDEPLELEPAQSSGFKPIIDRRIHIPEPLPVRLIAVQDMRLIAWAGVERELDAFYAGVLGFAREQSEQDYIYRADNFLLIFTVLEPPIHRPDYRSVGIEVAQPLAEVEKKLVALEMEYTRRRGLVPGNDLLVLTDPAGNWVEISEQRTIR